MSFLRDTKRLLAVLVAGIVGLVVLIDFAGVVPGVAPLARILVNWAAILTALALLVGLLSVVAAHLRRVSSRATEWGFSALLLLSMLTVIIVGIFFPVGDNFQLPRNLAEQPIRAFFRIVYEPLASSLLALLAFFSLSAALRAFRRRSAEAIVILVVAMLVLVTQLPPIFALPFVGETVQWFNDYIALAGARGLLIGTAIGTLVACVRVLLGFDQPFLDR